jgi:signal transduction histidine kinase
VIVAVQDSGPGLKPESFERLFDPFYTTKPDGMGMGLSICRSIVEAHGGRVWASRKPGPGLTVQFTVPVGDSPQPEATRVRRSSAVDSGASSQHRVPSAS